MTDALYVQTADGPVKVDLGTGSGGTASRTVSRSTSRDAVLAAGTEYTVSAHTVGKNLVAVYLDGVRYDDFTETSSTSITFDVDIPTTMEITVVVDA